MGRAARPTEVTAAVARVEDAMEHAAHLDGLRREGRRVASLLGALSPHDPVTTRPGATVRDVVVDLGARHRAAIDAVALSATPGAAPTDRPAPDASGAQLGHWLLEGVDAAVAVLAACRPADPARVPFPARPRVASWSRRLCHETAARRVDLALVARGAAAGVDAAPDPSLASDAIDEHLTVVVPHEIALGRWAPPWGRLAITCPEPGAAWLVSVGARYEVARVARPPDAIDVDASLAGPAPRVLGVLLGWRGRGDGVVARGEGRVLDGWTARPVSWLR